MKPKRKTLSFNKELGQLLRSARTAAKKSRVEAAAYAGVSPNALAAWELGYFQPGVLETFRLCQFYTVDMAGLVRWALVNEKQGGTSDES